MGLIQFEHVAGDDQRWLLGVLGLPKLDGIEMIKRTRDQGKSFPMLILTARGHSMTEGELRDARIHSVVAKPFSPRSILLRIQKLIQSDDPAAVA